MSLLTFFSTLLALLSLSVGVKVQSEGFQLVEKDTLYLREGGASGRMLQSGPAQGYFDNFVMQWNLSSFDDPLVDMELNIRVVVTSGTLSAGFQIAVYHRDFGSIVGEPTVTQDGIELLSQHTTEGDLEKVNVNLAVPARAGESISLVYKFQVEGGGCIRNGKMGFDATWVSVISEITAQDVQLIWIVPRLYDSENVNTFYSPASRAATIVTNNETVSTFANYDPDSIGFANPLLFSLFFRDYIFFYWEPNAHEFSPVRECPDIDRGPLWLIVFIILPILLCGFLGCCCFFAWFKGKCGSDRNGRGGNGIAAFGRPGHSNDIILIPGDRPRSTVRAVLEEDDDKSVASTKTIHMDWERGSRTLSIRREGSVDRRSVPARASRGQNAANSVGRSSRNISNIPPPLG